MAPATRVNKVTKASSSAGTRAPPKKQDKKKAVVQEEPSEEEVMADTPAWAQAMWGMVDKKINQLGTTWKK